MTRKAAPSNVAASVGQRLKNLAKARGEEAQYVLTRYALERLLYRLAVSPHAGRFLHKGAMLFQVWTGQSHRPTRDLDLLGHGSLDASWARAIFADICSVVAPDDGLRYDAATVLVEEVREDQTYGGLRVRLRAEIGSARIPLQVDVGIGDAVTPSPVEAEYPVLLPEFPAPRLRTYPRESVVAEKFQAIVMLGAFNTRIKDFYDVWVLARDFDFEGEPLAAALAATFARRGTSLPAEPPVALTAAFWHGRPKWRAFLTRSRLVAPDEGVVTGLLRDFLMPPSLATANGATFARRGKAGGGWR